MPFRVRSIQILCLLCLLFPSDAFGEDDVFYYLKSSKTTSSRLESSLGRDSFVFLPRNTSVLMNRDFEKSPFLSLPETLQSKEGVTISDETGLGLNARVDLRGFGGEGKQALVLFDDLRAVEPFDNSVTWNLYPAEFLERVDIERGGSSTVYGEGAFSGVIHLRSKSPTRDFHILNESAWGSFGSERYFTETSGMAGPVGFYIAARYFDTDGYRENSRHESTSTLWKMEAALTDQVKAKNTFYFARNETGIPGPLSSGEMERDRRQKDPDGHWGDAFNDRLLQESFEVRWLIEDAGLEFTNIFGFRSRDQDSEQTFGGSFPGTSSNQIETDTLSNITQGVWLIGGQRWKNSVTAGVEWSADDIYNPSEYLDFSYGFSSGEKAIDRQMTGLFLQDHFFLNEALLAEANLRWDQIRWNIYDLKQPWKEKPKIASALNPGLGLEYLVTKQFSLYGNYSRSFKAPDANALIFETPNLFSPNPDIDPQAANSWEWGMRHSFGGTGFVKADYFLIETKKEILFNDFTNRNENFDTRRNGVEIAAAVYPVKDLEFFTNATFTHAVFDEGPFSGKRIPLTPDAQWAGGFSWSFLEHWLISAEATGVYEQFALNDFKNIFPTDDYWTAGMKLSYRKGPAEIFLKIQNLFDNRYCTFVASNAVDTVNFNPSPGRTAKPGSGFCFRVWL